MGKRPDPPTATFSLLPQERGSGERAKTTGETPVLPMSWFASRILNGRRQVSDLRLHEDRAGGFVDKRPIDVFDLLPGADLRGQDEDVFAVAEFLVHLHRADDPIEEP